jgi:hypothetical protein
MRSGAQNPVIERSEPYMDKISGREITSVPIYWNHEQTVVFDRRCSLP